MLKMRCASYILQLAITVIVGINTVSAQTPISPTQTYTGATTLVAVEADVLRLITRTPDAAGQYPFYVALSTSLNPDCLNSANATPFWPVIRSDRVDSKAIRETLQLAFVTQKRVRIYSAQCASMQQFGLTLQYPVIWAVETL